MKKKIITTKNLPIGPYNQAIEYNGVLYISGQIAINSNTKNIITNNITDETLQVMKNLDVILDAANMTFENVVKSSIFITDMNNFDTVNNIYGTFFNKKTAPAREIIEVSKLPKNTSVKISMIAVR